MSYTKKNKNIFVYKELNSSSTNFMLVSDQKMDLIRFLVIEKRKIVVKTSSYQYYFKINNRRNLKN